jgi:hypothetical protein
MAIQIVPYTEQWIPEVLAFNDRMHGAGVPWGWYGSPVDEWLPEREGRKTWREHYLAIEDERVVRGAYALKPHEWWIAGRPVLVSDWQGPVSEGAISRHYNTLGLRLLREMLRRYPLLYSWGHGGLEQPMLQMLEKLDWLLLRTPFCLRILHPARFLRRNAYLRGSAARRAALDALAFSGAGALGLHALHAALALRRGARRAPVEVREFARFEPWADELWQSALPHYRVIACRDAATMNTLLPADGWPRALRLRVLRGADTLGWAVVMDTQMRGDPRFGSLRVGSIVDVLAAPAHAADVVGGALATLRARGVDIAISNQAHPDWVAAFAAHGFLILRDRRVFAASPALLAAMGPLEDVRRGLHLTNMDGHGPMQL